MHGVHLAMLCARHLEHNQPEGSEGDGPPGQLMPAACPPADHLVPKLRPSV